jgi:hypothetical protein
MQTQSAHFRSRRRGQRKTTYFRFENEQNKFLIRPANWIGSGDDIDLHCWFVNPAGKKKIGKSDE